MTITIDFEWHEVGEVVLCEAGRPYFWPRGKSGFETGTAKVYMIESSIVGEDGRPWCYIGETSCIRQRWGNYRSGNANQVTSEKVHRFIKQSLDYSGRVKAYNLDNISVIIDNDVQILENYMSLANKDFRLLLESAAIAKARTNYNVLSRDNWGLFLDRH